MKVLFFGKYNCEHSKNILEAIKKMKWNVLAVWSKKQNEILPDKITGWKGDYIFCFRSYFILKKSLFCNARFGAINFHPAPPNRRGSGAINKALANNDLKFGATCHQIDEKIDHGDIIDVTFFKIDEKDVLDTLLTKAHIKCFKLALKTLNGINKGGQSYIENLKNKNKNIHWSGPVGKLKEVNKLQYLDLNLTQTELKNRIKSYHTDAFPLIIDFHGYKFELNLKK
jgi:methionyl-tRNA formyltransferase